MKLRSISFLAASLAPLLLAGCNITAHKSSDGKDVNIDVPFASMHVKTDKDADVSGIGLTVYPGAQPAKDNDGDSNDNDAADIHMNFGDFHLGVKAASFQTADSPAKVEAFYRNDMKRYGDVIKCQGDQTIGTPVRTSSGLTCQDDHHGGGHTAHGVHFQEGVAVSDRDEPELRAGSPTHQHVVSIKARDGGTKFGLVMLDLPGSHDNDSKQSE